jgi:hypothetical protein
MLGPVYTSFASSHWLLLNEHIRSELATLAYRCLLASVSDICLFVVTELLTFRLVIAYVHLSTAVSWPVVGTSSAACRTFSAAAMHRAMHGMFTN